MSAALLLAVGFAYGALTATIGLLAVLAYSRHTHRRPRKV